MRFLVFGLLFLTAVSCKSIGTVFEDDAFETQLVKEVSDLYDNAIKAIDTLAKTGKDKLIDGLEKAITFVKSIGTKVDALKPDTDYGKGVIALVDNLVKKGEALLQKELDNAKAGTTDHGNSKDDLIKEVKTLYEQAKAAFEALEKSDKKTLKEALTAIIAVGKQVQEEFKKLKPDTDVGKAVFDGVSKLFDDVVAFLKEQLKSLGSYYEDDEIEAQLVKEVSDLYDNAIKAIDTLAKTGKDKLVDGLEKAITFVKSIGTKVDALKPDTVYGKGVIELVDKLVTKGNELLENELKNAKAGITKHGDSKDELVKEIKDLYEKAKAAFDALEQTEKKVLKEALTKIVEVGKQVQTEFKTLKPDTDVGKAVFDGVSKLFDEVIAFLELKLKSLGF